MIQRQKIILQTPGMALFDPATLARFVSDHGIEATDLLQHFIDFPELGDAAIAQGCVLPVYSIPMWDYELVFNEAGGIATAPPLVDAVLPALLPLAITSGTLIVTDLFGLMDFDLEYYRHFPPAQERTGVDAAVQLAPGSYAVQVVKFIDRLDADIEHRRCGYEFLLNKVSVLPAVAGFDVDNIPYTIAALTSPP